MPKIVFTITTGEGFCDADAVSEFLNDAGMHTGDTDKFYTVTGVEFLPDGEPV